MRLFQKDKGRSETTASAASTYDTIITTLMPNQDPRLVQSYVQTIHATTHDHSKLPYVVHCVAVLWVLDGKPPLGSYHIRKSDIRDLLILLWKIPEEDARALVKKAVAMGYLK